MKISMPRLAAALAVVTLASAACGGSSTQKPAPTSPAGGTPSVSTQAPAATSSGAATTAPAATSSAAATTAPSGAPTVDATEQAAAQQFRDLGTMTLTVTEFPPGCSLRSNQPVLKKDVATADIAIPKLATFFNGSDLQGAWGTLCTRDAPSSGISSIVYKFATAASATGLVDTTASLVAADYPGATAIDRLPADPIGDKSVFNRYRLTGALVLELTWADGALCGQVILRYAGDVEDPGDPAFVIALAKAQADKMPKPTT